MERLKQVTLLLTRACNLRCSYCYVRTYSGGEMTLETANGIVRDVFARDLSGYDGVEFIFLGGEPFCAFPLLRELSEWIWSGTWPKPYFLSAVTNGTLLRGEIRAWLTEHREKFSLTLSYDGEGQSQNTNRSQSDDMIDLEYFHRLWPEVPVKMTITEANVAHMAEDILRLRNRGIPVNDTFAGGVPVWGEASLAELGRQLQKLCSYELERPDTERRSDLLSIDLRGVLRGGAPGPFACGAGESRVTYTHSGERCACHLLSDLVLDSGALERLKGGAVERVPMEGCGSCPLDPICPTCEGNSFRLYGCFGRREESQCALFRRQVYYACRYQAKRILRRGVCGERDRMTLAAVKKLMGDRRWFPAEVDGDPEKGEGGASAH